MKQKGLLSLVLCLLVAAVVPDVGAAAEGPMGAIALTAGVPYTQDFDSLANTGTSGLAPDGWAFSETGAGANTTYTAGAGSNTAGDTYSFGAAGAAERAFGGLQSSSVIPIIGAEFRNDSGEKISNLTLNFTCEQWRIGVANRGAADRLDFQYSTDATSLTSGAWNDVDLLDCASANTSDTLGAKNGNDDAYRIAVSGDVTGLSIANGATFWLRWIDFNIGGSDDGLGVDNFVLTAQPTTAITLHTLSATSPSPAPAPFAGLALLGGFAAILRRRKV
jgi:MYXO-CTERM domain-containing protein